MTPNIKHLLKCLTSLAERLTDQEFLYVLSAWRGPDGVWNGDLKWETTMPIRRAVLYECGAPPGLVESNGGEYLSFSGQLIAHKTAPVKVVDWRTHSGDDIHFYDHVRLATEALGLEIEEI